MKEVVLTGTIPQCPFCDKPTNRTAGFSSKTSVYFPPIYDENGNNINPDRNQTSTRYQCLECENFYNVIGNSIDGYHYQEV